MAARHVARGVLAGVISGPVASWMMSEFTLAVRDLTARPGGNAAEAKAEHQSEG